MTLEGLTASGGISRGVGVVFVRPSFPYYSGCVGDPKEERERFLYAVEASVVELVALQDKTRQVFGEEYAHIFRSQQTIIEDAELLTDVARHIGERRVCAESAMQSVFDLYRQAFHELDDGEYNKDRLVDINDVHTRLLRNLLGMPEVNLMDVPPSTVVVAQELYPSDTALMDTTRVVAIVTERGGIASHVAILAKNLGIPAVVKATGAVSRIEDNDTVIVDASYGSKALVYVNPDTETERQLERQEELVARHRKLVAPYRTLRAITTDGVPITLSANVGSTAELIPAQKAGSTSIGLYRSEFLFLNSPKLPDEETQYRAYRRAVELFHEGFVVIRTLDAGGDKQVPAIPIAREDNPFLGQRGIRLSLARPELLRTQLKAILRASAHGPIKLMFPLIGGVVDLERALSVLEEEKAGLRERGVGFDERMEVGIAIEVPSAVWVAEALARRVDFFSVGTNDLTQYLMAADRLNSEIEEYYRSFDPSVFRAIRAIVVAAQRHSCWVGVCGELGGDPVAIPALVGLGVTELSMSPPLLSEATWLIRHSSMEENERVARTVLSLDSHREIQALLHKHYLGKE